MRVAQRRESVPGRLGKGHDLLLPLTLDVGLFACEGLPGAEGGAEGRREWPGKHISVG